MIYLDSAATSLMKPPQVGNRMLWALHNCASPGRGIHKSAMMAAEVVFSCREMAAKLFHVTNPEQVIFTSSATHGLNIAIRSIVSSGDRVVVSGYEHNAVLRPLYALGAFVDAVQTPLFDHEILLDEFTRRIPGAAAVVCTHVSNVFGYILPILEIAKLCKYFGVPLIVDASQSAGVLDIDFEKLNADYLAMPGHKGLMGPQGTGILLCKNGAEPLLYGGTGSMSASSEMPQDLPDRLEAGTQNVCGIAGLREGIRFVQQMTPKVIRYRENSMLHLLKKELFVCRDLQIFAAEKPMLQSSVLSVVPKHMDCEEYAALLGKHGVAVRAGLHCAPLAHRTVGTEATGTVRFSLSPYTTVGEIKKAIVIMQKI